MELELENSSSSHHDTSPPTASDDATGARQSASSLASTSLDRNPAIHELSAVQQFPIHPRNSSANSSDPSTAQHAQYHDGANSTSLASGMSGMADDSRRLSMPHRASLPAGRTVPSPSSQSELLPDTDDLLMNTPVLPYDLGPIRVPDSELVGKKKHKRASELSYRRSYSARSFLAQFSRPKMLWTRHTTVRGHHRLRSATNWRRS